MPDSSLRRQYNHTNHTTRTAVPLDRLLQRLFDEIDALFFRHVLFPVGITITVDVRRSGTANRVGLFVERTTERDGIHLAAVALIVTSDDDTGATNQT